MKQLYKQQLKFEYEFILPNVHTIVVDNITYYQTPIETKRLQLYISECSKLISYNFVDDVVTKKKVGGEGYNSQIQTPQRMYSLNKVYKGMFFPQSHIHQSVLQYKDNNCFNYKRGNVQLITIDNLMLDEGEEFVGKTTKGYDYTNLGRVFCFKKLYLKQLKDRC